MTLTLELDDDGYPTIAALRDVAWHSVRSREDCAALLAAVSEVWTYAGCWKQDGDVYRVSTGGWSGNESLIEALQENKVFWLLCWRLIRRGGHFEFELPTASAAAKESA